jgi:hypothetical protein
MTRIELDEIDLRNRIIILIWIETSEILRIRRIHNHLYLLTIRHS